MGCGLLYWDCGHAHYIGAWSRMSPRGSEPTTLGFEVLGCIWCSMSLDTFQNISAPYSAPQSVSACGLVLLSAMELVGKSVGKIAVLRRHLTDGQRAQVAQSHHDPWLA